jgi:hypothetical protein
MVKGVPALGRAVVGLMPAALVTDKEGREQLWKLIRAP